MRRSTWFALGLWLLIVALVAALLVWGRFNPEAGLDDTLSLAALLAFGTVGAVILARRPHHFIGWLFCLDVLSNGVASLATLIVARRLAQPAPPPGTAWLAWFGSWLSESAWPLLFMFTFLLFPDGRLPSRRWRPLAWFIAGLIVFHTLVAMFRPGPFAQWPALTNPLGLPLPAAVLRLDAWLYNLVVPLVAICVASLVWRFRAARGEARQQIKWMAYVAVLLIVFIGLQTLFNLEGVNSPGAIFFNLLVIVTLVAFPVVVGLSILRYHLWDIDVLIRRTLIYGVLTAALALLYGVSTIVLQQVFRTLTGQSSQLTIVLSTLGIAAAFAPLRRRIQAAIDRRFYRRKVDAAQTLAAFGAAARDEVDLDRLTRALLDTVGASFQPEHTSLWLTRPAPRP